MALYPNLVAMPGPVRRPANPDGTASNKNRAQTHMTVIDNQPPTPRKPPRPRQWRDWLVISLTAGSAWLGLCWLVAWLAR